MIFGLLALPTASSGPVGFWPKVPINLLAGLAGDAFFSFTKYKKWSIFVGFYIIATLLLYLQTFTLIAFGIPESAKILSIMHFVVIGFWIIGTLGLLLGFYTWEKIQNKNIIKQIQN